MCSLRTATSLGRTHDCGDHGGERRSATGGVVASPTAPWVCCSRAACASAGHGSTGREIVGDTDRNAIDDEPIRAAGGRTAIGGNGRAAP